MTKLQICIFNNYPYFIIALFYLLYNASEHTKASIFFTHKARKKAFSDQRPRLLSLVISRFDQRESLAKSSIC